MIMKFYKSKIAFVTIISCLSCNLFGQTNKNPSDSIAYLQAQQLKQTEHKNVYSNSHPNAQWFPKAGLGLFIHWGMAAVSGTGDLSWGMLANKPWKDSTMTPNAYYALANKWNPSKMDFDKMLKAAKAAGITYAVFVTKHHDGFTLWPSSYGEIGTKFQFAGRDFVKEFVTACRKYDIKVGLYYSPPDWYFERKYKNFSFNNKVQLNMDHQPTQLPKRTPEFEQSRISYIQHQVTELLTNYGKIDLIWFDGGKGEIPNAVVRALQPGIVINRRNGGQGDYGDSEGALPKKKFQGWFETCETSWPSDKWSYVENRSWDKAPDVITELVKLRAWGGNLLANLGPMASGEVPMQALTAWKEMASWMKHNRESVIGANAGPWPEDVNTPVTTNKGVAYIHFLPSDTSTVVWKNVPKPSKVFLLRTKQPVIFDYQEGVLEIKLPEKYRTQNVDVVKMIFNQ